MYKINLRAIEPEDLDWLYIIENDEETWEVSGNNVPYSRYALHEYVANNHFDIFVDRQLRLIVELQANKTPIGVVDLFNFDPINSRAEVGIVIERAYRESHCGKQALEKLIEYANIKLHINQLYSIVAEDNHISQHLFAGVGFECSGRLKNWLKVNDGYSDAYLYQFFCKKDVNILQE